MIYGWIAALSVSAQAAPIAIVMREGDIASRAAPAAVTRLAAPDVGVWQANGEEVERTSLILHLTPYFSDTTHDFKQLRQMATDAFKLADASQQTEDFRKALTAATVIPPVQPEARSLVILRVEREFAVLQLRNRAFVSADRLLLDIGFHTDFAPEDFPKPYKQYYEALIARRDHSVDLAVSIAPPAELELSLDGSAFAKRISRVTPGVHQLIARVDDKIGLAHDLEVPAGSPFAVVLQADVERGLVFTPEGFFVRADAPLTPAMSALVLKGTPATRVWLVETLHAAPPEIRVSVSDGLVTRSAVVPLKSARLLHPATPAEEKDFAEAIVAAARAAESGGVQPLAHYDVVHGSSGDLALVAAEHEPLYKKWWLWTAVGAVVVAGAVTAVVLATRESGLYVSPAVTAH